MVCLASRANGRTWPCARLQSEKTEVELISRERVRLATITLRDEGRIKKIVKFDIYARHKRSCKRIKFDIYLYLQLAKMRNISYLHVIITQRMKNIPIELSITLHLLQENNCPKVWCNGRRSCNYIINFFFSRIINFKMNIELLDDLL